MNTFTLFANGMTPNLGWTLLHSLWQGTIIALVLAGLLYLSRKQSANLRYLLACLALALIPLVAVLTYMRADENVAIGDQLAQTNLSEGSPLSNTSPTAKNVPVAEASIKQRADLEPTPQGTPRISLLSQSHLSR
jgi:hypothetical protein